MSISIDMRSVGHEAARVLNSDDSLWFLLELWRRFLVSDFLVDHDTDDGEEEGASNDDCHKSAKILLSFLVFMATSTIRALQLKDGFF